MRKIVIMIAALSACGDGRLIAAQTCEEKDVTPALRQVKAQQADLLAFRLEGEMDDSVPVPLQPKIRAFKDALTAFADGTIGCSSSKVDPGALESKLSSLLDANKPVVQEVYDPKKPPQLDHIYGAGLSVRASVTGDSSHLLLIELGFGIECGQDTMLLGYEFAESRWQRVLRWQSGDYKEISGAFGDFFKYVVIPAPAPQGPVIAVAHGTPWCTSNLSGFKVDLVESGRKGSPQREVAHLDHEYRRDYDVEMKATADGFQLRADADSLDGGIVIRPGVFRYRLDGGKLERVQPIANNGRDFVDEWLQVPWSDAQRWSALGALPALQQLHDKIQNERSGAAEDWPMIEYGAVRACSDSPMHYQVEMTEDRSMNKPPGTNNTIYFQIEVGRISATMLSASSASDPRCTGKDIMPKQ